MSEPVAELIAELGFDVDKGALAGAEAGLQRVQTLAERVVSSVSSIGGAFKQFGLGVRQGMQQGAAEALSNAGLDPKRGVMVGIKQKFAESFARETDRMGAPAAPGGKPAGGGGGAGGHGPAGAVTGLTGVLNTAQHVMHGFLGLFAAHEIQHFAHEMMDAASQTELASKRLGLTTEALQELQYAANASDISAGSLNNALKFLQVNSTRAASGGKAQAKAFSELGVSVKDAEGNARPVDALLEDVAEKFTTIKDPAKQTALAMQLFGRAGAEMVPMLQEGREGIVKLREEAVALGGGLSETLIENAGEYEKALKAFNFGFLSVKSAIGNVLLPALTRLTLGMTWLIGKFTEAYQKTKFFQALLGVGLAVTLAKLAMWLNVVGWAGVRAWLMNVGPVLLLAAAIAGVSLVLEDLYQGLTGGRSAIGKWIDEWQGIGAWSEGVRSIAAGIDSITQAIRNFANSPWQALKSLLGDVVYVMGAKDVTAQDELANRAVATGRGLGADARSNIDIPRATGRGLGAGAESSFGQARASILDPASASRDSAPINVTVNAHTGATPKEIGHHVKTAIEEHQTKRNRNLRRALVPHAD